MKRDKTMRHRYRQNTRQPPGSRQERSSLGRSMDAAALYTPNLSILNRKGITLTDFPPDTDAAGFLLSRTRLESGAVTAPLSYYIAARPELGFLYVRSGSLLYTAFPSELPVTLSGEAFMLFDCSFPYRIMVRAAAEYEILYFSGPGMEYFRTHLLGASAFLQNPRPAVLLNEAALLFQKEDLSPILCHGLLTGLLTRMAMEDISCPENTPVYLKEIREELSSQYYLKHTLEELEQKYKINRYRICREFKEYFRTSPMQHLHKIRIQAAKSLLLETDMKIHEISYEVGYENVNHFIHHFKRLAGLTPMEYRNKLL